MEYEKLLSDYGDPTVQAKVDQLVAGKTTQLEKLESIFNYVRDGVKFGFPPKWDEVKASEIMRYGVGYCNTKATLFVALCKAAGIPARVHYALIDVQIMRGVFPSFALLFLPKAGGHSWSEVQVNGEWKHIDSYINDRQYYEQALKKLKKSGHPFGYSVSFVDGKSSCDFNFGEKGFVHMGAVVGDQGVWDDAAEYFATDKYTRMNALQRMSYPMLAKLANRNISKTRSAGA
jgi:hypothetical protein